MHPLSELLKLGVDAPTAELSDGTIWSRHVSTPTQFTLQLDHRIFGLWRQSLDRDQSVFALHNVSADHVEIDPFAINLIEGEDWVDLISGRSVDPALPAIRFAPYECQWITNRA